MSVGYTWVQWNRHKRVYDAVLVGGVVLYLFVFLLISKLRWTGDHALSDPIILMRAFGTLAIVMLHMVLLIGPLARINRLFLPLLYNRRHVGVATFLVALCHGVLAMGFYHGFGALNPLVSLLSGNTNFASVSAFPFEILGLIALAILFLMAATSHDFWNKNLGPGSWKALHMMVYVAYVLLVLHVALGALQAERSSIYSFLLAAGAAVVVSAHLFAGLCEARRDKGGAKASSPWTDVGSVDDIKEDRAKVACLKNQERIAIFKYDGKISAVSNVCRHQGGPLGEGKVIKGCITCPWHGWQYRPGDGQSPPPFQEKIETYQVRLEGSRILVNPTALPAGTSVEPAIIGAAASSTSTTQAATDEFYVGYFSVPANHRRFARIAATIALLLMAGLSAGIASLQRDPGPAVWEIDKTVQLTGIALDQPYAMLVRDPGDGEPQAQTVLLVGEGKFGATERLRPFIGRRVTVTGTTLTRSGMLLLELISGDDAIKSLGPAMVKVTPPAQSQGTRTMRGEIIDPKCYFGAMKPGEGKTHKACAILCIRGGIPPVFATRNADGRLVYYLIADTQGRPANDMVIPFVGDPVEVTGEIRQGTGMMILELNPEAIRRQ